MFMFYLCNLYLFTYTGVEDVHVLFMNYINKTWTSSTPVYVNKYKWHK
jgi:hypothetical protein